MIEQVNLTLLRFWVIVDIGISTSTWGSTGSRVLTALAGPFRFRGRQPTPTQRLYKIATKSQHSSCEVSWFAFCVVSCTMIVEGLIPLPIRSEGTGSQGGDHGQEKGDTQDARDK